MGDAHVDRYNAAEDLLGRNLGPGRRERIAYVDTQGEHTYAALADRAARFAGVLAELGVQREQRVALCMTDTMDLPACILGAMQHGAVPIPLNTRLTAKDYRFILGDSRARVAVVSASRLEAFDGWHHELGDLAHLLVAGDDRRDGLTARLSAATPAEDFADTRRDEVAFWLYTSGTTGQPKGAVHAHGHLLPTAEHYGIGVLGIRQDDVLFSAAKVFFAYGLGNALTFPLAVGATTILLEGPPTPEAVTDILRRHDPTVFYGVPTLYGMLLSRPELLPSGGRLRRCVSAGEALPPDLLRRWTEHTGVEILDGLGSTEALHVFLSNRAGEVRPGSTGRPVEGYGVRLVEDDGGPVPVGEPGNLEVRGPSVALMYWNRRERSKDTFRGHWMRTGDKYRCDDDGYYYYEGRADDLMKVGGIWVSPFEVESTLLEHPAVLECAVVGHADADGLIKPRAFVVCTDGVVDRADLAAELQTFARARMAAYKRPRWVELVDALPKTATGKIQRFRLRVD